MDTNKAVISIKKILQEIKVQSDLNKKSLLFNAISRICQAQIKKLNLKKNE